MNPPLKIEPDAPVKWEDIPITLDMARVFDRLKTGRDHPGARELTEMARQAERMPGATAGFVRVPVREVDRKSAVIALGPARFSSRILAKSLDAGHWAFAVLATLGSVARQRAQTETDLLKSWWWQGLFDLAMERIVAYVMDEIKRRFSIQVLSILSPGSLADWPLDQQKEMFRLFGALPGQLGVRLTADMVMEPCFSVSGLMFETPVPFCSCAFCPRESCESRRMPFDPDLHREHLGAD